MELHICLRRLPRTEGQVCQSSTCATRWGVSRRVVAMRVGQRALAANRHLTDGTPAGTVTDQRWSSRQVAGSRSRWRREPLDPDPDHPASFPPASRSVDTSSRSCSVGSSDSRSKRWRTHVADAVLIHTADDPERSIVVPDRVRATEQAAWLTARSPSVMGTTYSDGSIPSRPGNTETTPAPSSSSGTTRSRLLS